MLEQAAYPSKGWSEASLSTAKPNTPTLGKKIALARERALEWANTPHGVVAFLIAITLVARLLFASSLGLGIDESYMVAASRKLQFGYFDHPPIAWWLAWAVTHLFGTESEVVVRLPFVLLFAVSTWLIFRLTCDLFDASAGLWAAAALNAVPVLGVTTGSWVLPDGPLVAALLGAVACLVRAMSDEHSAWGWWLGGGTCFGLAMCSKYVAAPIGVGAVIYLLTQPQARRLLARPHPYVAAAVALAMFSPVIAWNAAHGWVSLLFQGGRASGGKWYPFGPISTLAGEALFFLPWIWMSLLACLWHAIRVGPADPRRWLLVCLSLPTILLFELVSLRNHVLFHWAAPGTMLALPLLGEAIARIRRSNPAVTIGVVLTAAIVTLGALLVATEVRFNWLPDVGEDFAMGRDPDLGAVDWDSLRMELSKRGELHSGVVVAAVRWGDAGKIDYALHGVVRVICLGNDPREYGISSPAAGHVGQDLLIVAPRETLRSMAKRYGTEFRSLQELPPVILRHAGMPAMVLPLFMGRGFELHA
jgi:4-amino-4-deoxy-L-arabinose transferase-like glycosyltransferase